MLLVFTRRAVRVFAAVKFSKRLEEEWLVASALGFLLDVFVYHTFSLFVRAVMKFLGVIRGGTDRSTLANGLARSVNGISCAFSGIYTVTY